MNQRPNFGLGLLTGVAICLISFGLLSSTTTSSKELATNDQYSGDMISVDSANTLIAAYANDWVSANELPANTTIGGYIGRANLANVANTPSEEQYVKFNFYFTKGPENAPQIGLILYPTEESQTVLRTGSNSFCPTVCTQPN